MSWFARTRLLTQQFSPIATATSQCSSIGRHFARDLHTNKAALDRATKLAGQQGRWHKGKLIVEETEDPAVYPYVLLRCHSYDEGTLKSYSSFVKSSAKMLGINVTKSFSMPADVEKVKTVEGVGIHKRRHEHSLKTFKQVLQVTELTADNSDIFLCHIKDGIPPGVTLRIELLQWEKFVAPDHPSFRSQI